MRKIDAHSNVSAVIICTTYSVACDWDTVSASAAYVPTMAASTSGMDGVIQPWQ